MRLRSSFANSLNTMNPISAYDLLCRQESRLSFGCINLDNNIGKLGGGITEIAGEAGSGKTQICLVLSLQCQLPVSKGGLNGSCAYLMCGEGDFPIRRLSQLSAVYESKFGILQSSLLEKIHIEKCYTPEDAQKTLCDKLPKLCTSNGVKLLVIDSLAGWFVESNQYIPA